MIKSHLPYNFFCRTTCILPVLFATLLNSCDNDLISDRPNIIIFYTDNLGTLDVCCYGAKDIYTPNMDLLAKQGIMFTQTYGHTVSCPSRAAILTGRDPQRSGINEWT